MLLCLLLAAVLIVVSVRVSPILRPPVIGDIIDLNGNWQVHKNEVYIDEVDLPARIDAQADDIVTITRVLPDIPDGEVFLRIRTAMVSLKVTVDGESIYYYGDPSQLSIKNGIGGAWNFVDISGLRGSIVLEEISPYNSHAGGFSKVAIGKYSDLRDDVIISLTPAFAISLILTVFGVILILVGGYFSIRLGNNSVFFLGMFCAAGSLWSLAETRLLDIFLPRPYTVNMISYVSQIVAPLMLLLYIRSFYSLERNKFCNILSLVGGAEIGIFLLLQLFGVVELLPMLGVVHIYTVICMVYVVYVSIKNRKDMPRIDVRLLAAAYICVALSAITDLFFYMMITSGKVFNQFDSAFFFRIGFAIFSVLLTAISLRRGARMLKSIVELSAYKNDHMTGMLSRHVFDEDMAALENEKGAMKSLGLLLFDMNNLKLINDTQGHKAGDNSIIAVSTVLNRTFSEAAKCYRIGGDEFFVVLRNMDKTSFDELLNDFEEQVTLYNQDNPFKVDVAVGRGYFDKSDPNWQESIYNLFTLVDGKMYEDKRNKKGVMGRKSDMSQIEQANRQQI